MSELFQQANKPPVSKEPVFKYKRKELVKDRKTKQMVEKEIDYVNVLGVELPVFEGKQGSVFSEEEFKDFALDEASLDLLKRYAIAAKLNQPLLIEGVTDIGKSKALEYLSFLCNRRLYRLSMSGQTDTTEFIGKYVPNTEDARKTFEALLGQQTKMTPESRAIIDEADELARGLTEDECKKIAQLEGLHFGKEVQWVWKDGMVVQAMRHARGRGTWLYLDELGGAEPQILVKINRMFEKFGRLELAENGNRLIEAGADFRIFASTNPPEYAGRTPFAPDFLRRWWYQKIGKLTTKQIEKRLMFAFHGEKENVEELAVLKRLPDAEPVEFEQDKDISKPIVEFLAELHQHLQDLVEKGLIGKDQKQKFNYEVSDLLRIRDFLSAFGGKKPYEMLKEAAELYLVGKLSKADDAKKVNETVETVMTAKNTKKKIEEGLALRIKRQRQEARAAEATMRRPGEETSVPVVSVEDVVDENLKIKLKNLIGVMEMQLNDRAEIYHMAGIIERPTISVPEALTKEHLNDARLLGFTPLVLPESDQISLGYYSIMYPDQQSHEDERKLLKSFRADNLKQPAPPEVFGQIIADAHMFAISRDLRKCGGSLVLVEEVIKPKTISGKLPIYGTVEGRGGGVADPLQSALDIVYGPGASRFDHTPESLELEFIPAVRKHLQKLWPNLPPAAYEVKLVPAAVANLYYTFDVNGRQSTNTDSQEWTSTKLLDKEGKETELRLLVGKSNQGGAAATMHMQEDRKDKKWGFRLAIIFKNK